MRIAPLYLKTDYHPIVMHADEARGPKALQDYARANGEQLRHLLSKHGAILFRGFGLADADDFRDCCVSMGADPFAYVGGNSPRSQVAADVFTSTEYAASEVISLHNEMSYLPSWPGRLFFCSLIPAASGGQTSLANGLDVQRSLSDRVQHRLREKKISYISNFNPDIPVGKSWQKTYKTEDRGELEQILAAQGSSFQWSANGSLRVATRCEAFAPHPQSSGEVWFNQAEQWHASALNPAVRSAYEDMFGKGRLPHECEYGDGEPIETEALEEIRHALNANKLLFDWQQGDLLMIDNVQMMHGREAFTGTRKTLAYLSRT